MKDEVECFRCITRYEIVNKEIFHLQIIVDYFILKNIYCFLRIDESIITGFSCKIRNGNRYFIIS